MQTRSLPLALESISVASPCSADWSEMSGDDRRRHCAQCKLNVYNLSEMTRDEAMRFVAESEGRLCVRFFRRPDGTIITRDCPRGLAAARARLARMATAIAAMLGCLAVGSVWAGERATGSKSDGTGALARFTIWLQPPARPMRPVPPYTAIMGDMCIPPPPTPSPVSQPAGSPGNSIPDPSSPEGER